MELPLIEMKNAVEKGRLAGLKDRSSVLDMLRVRFLLDLQVELLNEGSILAGGYKCGRHKHLHGI